MKKLLIILLALIPLVALAQPPIVSVTDAGVSNELTCPPDNFNNCTSATFTVGADGKYDWDVWVACPTSHCDACMACSVIYETLGNTIVGTCSAGCPGAGCTRTCTVKLRAGVSYTIQSCLLQCPTGAEACGRDCTANACVRPQTSAHRCY
jgi:hypothetical protein